MTTATRTAKPDPKPGKAEVATKPAPKGPRKPRATKTANEKRLETLAKAEADNPAEPVIVEEPNVGDGEALAAKAEIPVTSNLVAMANLSAAAKASSERRAANEADRVTAKAKRAEDTAKRRATVSAWHQKVIDLFKSGQTTAQIAAAHTNEKTGEPYNASTILWILKKYEIVEKGEGRKTFDVSALSVPDLNDVQGAIVVLERAAAAYNTSVAKILKAVPAAS